MLPDVLAEVPTGRRPDVLDHLGVEAVPENFHGIFHHLDWSGYEQRGERTRENREVSASRMPCKKEQPA